MGDGRGGPWPGSQSIRGWQVTRTARSSWPSELSSSPPPQPPSHDGPDGGHRRGHGWLPVAIACLVAALVLLYILLPGVLIYPPEPDLVLDDGQALALQRDINQTLEERRRALEEELEGNACTIQGELLPPGPGDARAPGGQALPISSC